MVAYTNNSSALGKTDCGNNWSNQQDVYVVNLTLKAEVWKGQMSLEAGPLNVENEFLINNLQTL